MAKIIADKVIGEKHNGVQISSQYKLDMKSASVQNIEGKLKWVIPLDYIDFFKWFRQSSIPGYVIVSATEQNEPPKLVTDYKIVLSKNSFFLDNIKRFAYFKSKMKQVNLHFEINDKGEPFYIGLIAEPLIGLNALTTKKVMIINAQTKETDIVSPEEVKEKYPWIDRIVHERYVEQKIEWYGKYKNGFLNTIFGGLNINVPTKYKGSELWFVKLNKRNVFFTGMTSVNSTDQSFVQGIYVDTLTSKAYSFNLSGVMDEAGAVSVLDSALGADSYKWSPVLPQPIILNGEFYWGATIVSDNGIYQKVGMVNGRDPSKVFFAKTYQNLFFNFDNKLKDKEDKKKISVSKKVLKEILNKIEELEKLKERLRKSLF
jgi:hypothetical protein